MKRHTKWIRMALLLLALAGGAWAEAQPGGFGGPGGRPPMGGRRPGSRPNGDRRDWNRMEDSQQAQQVKQKKKVKEGDTFLVKGELRDSVSGEFLAFVNVAVLDSADSAFVKGAATNFDGMFEVQGIPAGSYLLRITAIGYRNRLVPFSVSNNTALGTLRVQPGATTLAEVEITAEKPLYAMDGEKLIYNVSEDPSIQTGTTEDALQNAPGVEVDVEGNITLRGVSSVEIWINDKPSKLTEENLKTYLQTLPANALARIETITNPSAKYATDAEAVINIITSAHIKSNRFVSFGVNGSNQPFVSPWVSYMWAKERWSVNLFASGRYSKRESESSTTAYRRRDDAGGGYDTTMRQLTESDGWDQSLSGNVFANVNYTIDSMSEIAIDAGGFLNRKGSWAGRSTDQLFYGTSIGDSLLRYSIGDSTSAPSAFGHFGADYTKKFDLEGHNLRIGFNGRYSRNHSEEWYNRAYTTYTALDEHRYLLTNSLTRGLDFDARYNRPYSKNGELSYGLRASWEAIHNEYSRYNDLDRTLVDSLRTYDFDGSEGEVEADVNWTHRWGGFTLSSGLGLGTEHTSYDYRGRQTNAPWALDDSNFWEVHFRPSIHLTYRTEDMHNFKLNYSLRISDPSESQLTRFRRYGEDSYSTGNPAGLEEALTHSMEAGWQKFFESFGNVGIEGYARWSSNEISTLTDAEYDQWLDRIVNYSIPYNMGSSYRYGANLNMTYRPSGFFNVRLYANLYDYGYRMEYDRQGVHQVDERDMWSYSFRLNAWTKLFDQYQLHLSAHYTSPTLSLMSERKARYSLNLGVRSDFFKRKLSVFVNVQDLFNWGGRFGSGSENTNPYYLTDSTNKMTNSRYISAGITLRFGKLELEKDAKEGSSEEGDSL
ncbi:MAG: TonB-dependent receptor [Bacteroidales bacterium]|nr:TonB-dependent receptor [Bacteroidales bacterium]